MSNESVKQLISELVAGEDKNKPLSDEELVKRIDPAKYEQFWQVDAEDAIRMMLAEGGPAEGITYEQLQEGPVRLNVADPDIPFLAQVNDLVPFPPRSLPAKLEQTAAFVPTGRIEFYKEEQRFRELGETVPTHKPPFDDTVLLADGAVVASGPTRTVCTELAGITISAYRPPICSLQGITFFVVFSNCTLSNPSPLMVAHACRSSVSRLPNTRRVHTALSPGRIVRLNCDRM